MCRNTWVGIFAAGVLGILTGATYQHFVQLPWICGDKEPSAVCIREWLGVAFTLAGGILTLVAGYLVVGPSIRQANLMLAATERQRTAELLTCHAKIDIIVDEICDAYINLHAQLSIYETRDKHMIDYTQSRLHGDVSSFLEFGDGIRKELSSQRIGPLGAYVDHEILQVNASFIFIKAVSWRLEGAVRDDHPEGALADLGIELEKLHDHAKQLRTASEKATLTARNTAYPAQI